MLLDPFWSSAAHIPPAYIDPGVGSIVLQVLLGGAIAALYFLKTSWHRIGAVVSAVFGGGRRAEDEASAGAPEEREPGDEAGAGAGRRSSEDSE